MSEKIGYLEDGTEVEILQKTDHGWIVRRIYEYEGAGDEYSPACGDPCIVGLVFDKPPTEKIDERIAKLWQAESEIHQRINAARNEERALLANRKRVEELAAQDKALQRVLDFFDGKITHYTHISRYGQYHEIIEAHGGAIPAGPDERGKTKLIHFFGLADGNYEWGINNWSDGSGSYKTVTPHTSYESAQAQLQEAANAWEPVHDLDRWLEQIAKYGLATPPGLAEEAAQKRLIAATAKLNKLRADVNAAEEDYKAAQVAVMSVRTEEEKA